MATMIKWFKKKCHRRSLPGRQPPSAIDLNRRLYDDANIPENNVSYHIYEEISTPPRSPMEITEAVESLSKRAGRTNCGDCLSRRNDGGNRDMLLEQQLNRYKISQRPLPPTPVTDTAPCPLCRRKLTQGEFCFCELRNRRKNVTCRCSENHVNRDCPEALIDIHFTRGRFTPSRSPRHSISLCSDPNDTVYVPESKCSDNSSGYYSDDDLALRLGSLGLHKHGLRGCLSHNGFHAVPKMGSKAVKRSYSTNDAPCKKKPVSPLYLSPVKLTTQRSVPSCGISRSTEKAKSNSGCKRKHSIGPAEGRQARIRTGLQTYRSLSNNRESQRDAIQQRLNFSADTPQKRLPKDSQLRKRLQEYKQTKLQVTESTGGISHKMERRNSLLYKNLVKSRMIADDNCQNRTQKVFIAYV
ncbi:hypothetical protein LOTGIDRAFT_171771 [Lottia gigantea]|uniref:Uncharacterized protein n=1 Tax=Lottia gigantea TaxID=225164 RepID=V4B5A5_LOTGI|nr:hypothetical protein LOTGIDRAFT_171771 [Lottia gigantea]ESP02696.1 hypothetical protein LOTGIDRAFT_171771 [Lottia gigantea]